MNERYFLIQKLINLLSSITEDKLAVAKTNDYSNNSQFEKLADLSVNKCEQYSTYQNSKIEELNMTDITRIMSVIKKINGHCKEIDVLKASTLANYQNEKKSIEQKSAEMIADMQAKYEAYKAKHFYSIKNQIEQLVTLLTQDYSDELNKATMENNDYQSLTYEMCEMRLYGIVEKINGYIQQLNAVDFDALVPPVKVEVNGESFVTYTGNRNNVQEYDCNSNTRTQISDSKPIRNIVRGILPYCKEAKVCIDTLVAIYDQRFNIKGFNSFVQSSASAWLSETEAKLRGAYNKRFDELFRDEKAEAIPKSFFVNLEEEGVASNVDLRAGTDTYNESITIGDTKLLVEDDPAHLE